MDRTGVRNRLTQGDHGAAGRVLRGCVLIVLAMLLGLSARADSFEDRLEQANGHLRSGDATRALELYRELQVDYPDEDRVIFGIGCAQYEQAGLAAGQSPLPPQAGEESQEAPAAANLYDEAATTFDRLAVSRDLGLQADAMFNRGNCAVRKAKFFAGQMKRDEAIGAYRQAIGVYEQLLEDAPEHAGARQNLDHARYELKLLLQQPEEEQPDQPKPVSRFVNSHTDIPGATVVVPEDGPSQVELVQGAGGPGS